MIDLNDLRYFVQIVECGGLAAAARKIGVQKSTLSRRVTALETQLGITLFQREQARFRPTDIGQRLYDHCAVIVRDAEMTEQLVGSWKQSGSGNQPQLPDARTGVVEISEPLSTAQESPVRRQDLVQLFILRSIRRKTLSSGDKLPSERDISATLGVARQAVREAIRSLEMSGVLRLQRGPRGGAFIRDIGSEGITYSIRNLLILGHLPLNDVLELRAAIFSQACRLAAERGDEADFQLMERNIQQLEIVNRTCDPIATIRPATEFYRLAAKASRNRLLSVFVSSIADIMEEMLAHMRKWPLVAEGENARRETLIAIRSGDSERAGAIIRAHLEETNLVLLELGTGTYAL